jgi:hypothetical protein
VPFLREAFAEQLSQRQKSSDNWEQGQVRHILPTVSDTKILLKVSFLDALPNPPILRVGSHKVLGKLEDTQGENWSFYLEGLSPKTPYTLRLLTAKGISLCAPWTLATFPAPDDPVKQFRLLIYTCAGGHELHNFLPMSICRTLQRGLSFKPDAIDC